MIKIKSIIIYCYCIVSDVWCWCQCINYRHVIPEGLLLLSVCLDHNHGWTVRLQAEVWSIDIAAKLSEYTDVQLSADDVRPGRKLITDHSKVVNSCRTVSAKDYL